MKRFRLTCTIFAVLLSFFLCSVASAGMVERWSRVLNLSTAQQTQIKKIVYQSRRKQITLKANLQLARLDMHQLLSQHKPDEAKVVAAVEKTAGFELAMKKSRILMWVRVKAVLTAKQAAKLARLNARKRARRKRARRAFRRWRQKRRWRRRRGGNAPIAKP